MNIVDYYYSLSPFSFFFYLHSEMLSESEQLLTDMEHTSTSKFINVHEQIVRVQQHVLDIQSDVQRDEATFAQINQAYQQVIKSNSIIIFL